MSDQVEQSENQDFEREKKVWRLLSPELTQNIGGVHQRIKIALWQDACIPIGGNVTEMIEKSQYDRLEAENSKLRAALEKSCICGEFGYIKDKCPACQALGGED